MGKTVWLINHYANHMITDLGGRHYYLAKYLSQNGYGPVIFCANMVNNQPEKQYIDASELFVIRQAKEINTPFVFVKVKSYYGNGFGRVKNMVSFYFNVKKAAKEYAKKFGKPDIIVASSVHPLTMVAGIQLAKKFGVKCISEVRDLWPESIVAYSSRWKRNNPLMRILYAGEKWIYKKSDYVIMTWPGGYDYIKEQGWDKEIPASKVVHISNGVDLESYIQNIREHPYDDVELNNVGIKSFVYTGSIKKVNNLKLLVSAAEILKKRNNSVARILVYGDGDELEELKNLVKEKEINSIVFKGKVPKQCVPSILSQCYVSILHNSSTSLDKYGQSQNKFFEYLAAGRPILMTYSVGHSVIKKYGCGLELEKQTPEAIAEAIEQLCGLSDERYREYCENAKECSRMFDYKELCRKLINIIKKCNNI